MQKNEIIFVVAGRLGEGVVTAKVEPFACSHRAETVYVFRERDGEKIEGVSYLTIPGFVRKIKIIRHLVEFFQLLFWALKLRPDCIVGIYTLPQGLRGTIVAKLIGCKCVVSVIGGIIEVDTYYKLGWFWKGINLWMLRACYAVTTTGAIVTNYLVRHGIAQEKIYELGGAINIDKFNTSNVKDRDIDILFAARFVQLKGPDRVLEVVRRLKQTIPDLKAVFVGTGDMVPEIAAKVKEYGLEPNVSLPGYVPEVASYFRRSKLLLMPSRTEGLSLSMLEAMSCGCVPVVSNVGNMTDAARHLENALVVDNYLDTEGFYACARRLLEDPGERIRLAACGEKLMKEKYSVVAQTRVVDAMLEGVR
jgi:glycosyltransferase involved in cell wall biosynthesis